MGWTVGVRFLTEEEIFSPPSHSESLVTFILLSSGYRGIYRGVNLMDHDTDHSDIKNAWSYTSSSAYLFLE